MPHIDVLPPSGRTHIALRENGLLVEIEIGHTDAKRLLDHYSMVVPDRTVRTTHSVSVLAQVDSSSEVACLSQSVFDALGLDAGTREFFRMLGMVAPLSSNAVRLRLPATEGCHHDVPSVVVVRSPVGKHFNMFGDRVPDSEVGCLIGRNVLDEAVLTYEGGNGRWTLSF